MFPHPLHRNPWIAIPIAALVLILAGLPSAAARPADVRAPAQVVAAYGPQLFLLSPAADQWSALIGLPAAVHAVLPAPADGGPERYIASGGAELPDLAAAAGLPSERLDADTAGKVYYFVDAQAEDARAQAGRFGEILYADAWQLLLALPAENEPALLETLPTTGISLALMPPDAIALAAVPPAPESRWPESTAGVAPAAAIAELLPLVTSQALADGIADLSGERPADIGGATAALATRYTFASTIRNAERYLYQRYVDMGLPVSYASWSYGSYSGRNVVAEIRGVVHPERIWLVGGHFDAISETPYTRTPGADDNGSGSAAALVIADILRGHRLADTVRFVHFSGEEQGHWGSQAYVRSLSSAGAVVMGFIDLDMIGWDGDGDRTLELHSGTRANSVDFTARFTSANQRYGQGLRLEVKGSSASRFSDHASFWDYGYPSFMAIENFFDDAIPRDRNPWYHKTGDLLARVDLDYVTRTARTALAMLAEAAGIDAAPLSTATAGPTQTPTTTATAGSTPMSACTELVANGGFEAAAAWTFAATGNPAGYSTAQAHSGARAVRLGVVPAGATGAPDGAPAVAQNETGRRNLLGELAPLGASYSTAYQTIAIPATAETVTLTLWRRPGTQATSSDFQRVMLLKPGSYSVIATVFKSLTTATAWQSVTFSLTPYRGQSLVLYFEVYNDDISAGARTWMYVDDVSALACRDATATPTVPPAATATATATPSQTATATPSPLPPTETPTPTPAVPATATATPSPTAASTATTAPTPVSACTEWVANGGFEAAAGWTFAATGNPAGYSTAQVHSGARAVRLGVVPAGAASADRTAAASRGSPERNLLGELAPDGASYSTAYQTISVPAAADTVTLAFWRRPGTQATSGDFQRALLLKPGTYAVIKTLFKTLTHATTWQRAEYDLTPYRGQSIVLYFEVYNDDVSAGARTWMYLDDVSAQACTASMARLPSPARAQAWLPLLIQRAAP